MISFKQFITEMGGWSKTITQDVKLTPVTAKKALTNMPKFEKAFNAYLKAHDYAPIKIGKPIGSTAYLEKDLKSHPDKEYGDIDIIFSMPRIQGTTESKNQSLYRQMVISFIKDEKPSYIYDGGSENGTNITVSVGDDKWAQVDLVAAFNETEDWTTHRMTPEHGLKGALMGFLYASLSELLNVSIGTSGVQVKHIDGEMVPFKKIKVDSVNTITTDIGHFALDTFNYLYNRTHAAGSKAQIAPLLKSNPGMKREDIKFDDLANAVRGMGKSFELNNMWGQGDLKHIKDYSDFISKIKATYIGKAEDAANASKFEKAATVDAKNRAEATKEMLRSKSKELIAKL
jgi:hypothetical protein